VVDLTSAPQTQVEGLPGRAFPRLAEGVSPGDVGAQLGRSVEEAGDVAQQIHERVQNQVRQTQLEDAHNQLQALSLGLTHDPQSGAYTKQGQAAFGLPQQYLPKYDDQAQKIVDAVPDPRARAAAQQAAGQVRNQLQANLDQHEITQHQQFMQQTSDASIFMAQRVAGSSSNNPQVIANSLDTIAVSLQNRADREGWAPEELQDHFIKAASGLHAEVVKGRLAQGDTQGASDYLYSNLANMDPQTSESLQRMTLNAASHDELIQNRQLKAGSDKLSKQGDDLLASGRLTPSWLHDHRDLLEPSEYRYFTRQLSTDKPEQQTDSKTFSDLIVRGQKGEDVRDDARAALLAGRLKTSDYKAIVDDVAKERPGWYKRGSTFLDQALDPGQLNPDPAAHLSKAQGLSDWQEWADAHPDATDAQAREQQQLITSHYALIDRNKTTLLMPAPKFLVGTRINPDLPATSKATMDALASGQITHEQAVAESKLIAQYRSTLKAQADAAAEAAAKRKAAQ
jgi:hypothetical protein